MGWTYPDLMALPVSTYTELVAWLNDGCQS